MKTLLLGLCVSVLTLTGACRTQGDETRLLLYETSWDRGGGTKQWWLPLDRLEKLPKWYPDKDSEPPFSLKKALNIARKWITTKGVGGGDVEEIVLRPIDPNENQYRFQFFYRIEFGVAPYGNHLTCIVLMDGTVLEPVLTGNSDKNK